MIKKSSYFEFHSVILVYSASYPTVMIQNDADEKGIFRGIAANQWLYLVIVVYWSDINWFKYTGMMHFCTAIHYKKKNNNNAHVVRWMAWSLKRHNHLVSFKQSIDRRLISNEIISFSSITNINMERWLLPC